MLVKINVQNQDETDKQKERNLQSYPFMVQCRQIAQQLVFIWCLTKLCDFFLPEGVDWVMHVNNSFPRIQQQNTNYLPCGILNLLLLTLAICSCYMEVFALMKECSAFFRVCFFFFFCLYFFFPRVSYSVLSPEISYQNSGVQISVPTGALSHKCFVCGISAKNCLMHD